MEDEGEVTDFLNIEISRQGTSVTLRQTGYINKLAKEWFPHGPPANVQLNSVPHPEDIRELVIHATQLNINILTVILIGSSTYV